MSGESSVAWSDEGRLAPYASKTSNSRGRVHPEEDHPYRSVYMRDRDRIIHSMAFRRLEYKTQVFVYHEGDHYRTRLTHTIEVAMIARTIARALRLNEDLTEAIALSHDLGHPPFGHAGESALAEFMKERGGFEHNVQALRIVDHVESRYPRFRGVNLTWETREAIAKHSKVKNHPTFQEFDEFAFPSIEAQVADLADSVAYNSHDLDDGLASGLLDTALLDEVGIWRRMKPTGDEGKELSVKLLKYQVIRGIINGQVSDIVKRTSENIKRMNISSPDDARGAGEHVASFSEEMEKEHYELKAYLRKNVYKTYRLIRMEEKAHKVVGELFSAYERRQELLPPHVQKNFESEDKSRLICDYIAGMTDKFALEEREKLFDPRARV